jgi:tetratricopeptide (TPR) repeat protein
MFFFDKEYQKAALMGLGGVGKTQIALHFAFWVKEHKPGYSVFWLPVLSRASFEQACIGIIKEYAIQVTDTEDPKESVQRYLSSKDAGKWLLIVDNADDIEVLLEPGDYSRSIYDYFPNSDKGLILFTTRSPKVAVSVAKSAVETVLEMSLEEATNYLERSLIHKALIKEDQGVTDLLKAVACLPLAITQAAAYINENNCTIAEYLQLFSHTDQNTIELMSSEFYDDTRYKGTKNAVATTWLVSFHQIRKIDEFAARLLSFMAWIESRDIPQSILPQASEQQLMQAIGILLGYGFLSRRSDRKTYDMHSLVHLATRVWIKKEEEMENTFHNVVSHLVRVFPSDEWENRELWQKYIPHATKVLETSNIAGDEGCQLGYLVGRCLNMDKRAREAVTLLKNVVRIREKTLAEDHPSRLASQHSLAGAYHSNGQVKEAVKLLEHVVRIQERILAKDHSLQLASQYSLAGAYQSNGQVEEAVKLLEHVVRTWERILAEDHPSRLTSQNGLAGAYRANGQIKEAVKLLEHVVRIREKTLAEDHPSRLASQHGLAGAYHSNKQIKEAVKLLKHMVRIREKTLAEDHPSRLISQHGLAAAYHSNGQVKEAVKLLEHVVRIQQKILAKDHPSQLASQHGLAAAYHANGQVKEAVKLLQHVVRIQQKILAKDHPQRRLSERLLLYIYKTNINLDIK